MGKALVGATVVVLVFAASALGFGAFGSVHTTTTGGIVYGVAVGDVNGDGNRDIIAANDGTGTDHISYLRGRGDGTFKPAIDIDDPSGPEGIAIGRFNADKRMDFAAANYADGNVEIFLGKKGGGFADKGEVPVGGPGPWIVRATDLNRDGKRDLVAGNLSTLGPNAVSVLLGKGDGSFRTSHDYAASSGAEGLAVGRMNGDKLPDVVVGDSLGTVSVLLARRNGTLSAPKEKATAGAGKAFDSVALADFNRDGRLDVALADYTGGRVLVLLGKGDGTLKQAIPTDAGSLSPNGIESGDFNRDGKPDVALANYSSPYGAGVFLGKGNGHFGLPKPYDGADVGEVIAAGRLNSDRGTDLVVGTDTGVDVFLNKPHG